jgi:hypothetical protein
MLSAAPAPYLEVQFTAEFLIVVVPAQNAWFFTTLLLWSRLAAH